MGPPPSPTARRTGTALLLAAALLPSPAAADEAAEAAKRFREAFSGTLAERLGPPGKVEKDATALLPQGIVVEPGPFDEAVRRLRAPVEERMALRERVMGETGAAPGSGADIGKAVRGMEAENADLRAQLQVKQERIDQLERQLYGRKSERTQVSDPKRAAQQARRK
ncbi:MAG: kinetochore protein SPC24, partial [Planctomycetes bacterium]|nr:kinetochore protein SPC24 [Planctomycetota bacterium]